MKRRVPVNEQTPELTANVMRWIAVSESENSQSSSLLVGDWERRRTQCGRVKERREGGDVSVILPSFFFSFFFLNKDVCWSLRPPYTSFLTLLIPRLRVIFFVLQDQTLPSSSSSSSSSPGGFFSWCSQPSGVCRAERQGRWEADAASVEAGTNNRGASPRSAHGNVTLKPPNFCDIFLPRTPPVGLILLQYYFCFI